MKWKKYTLTIAEQAEDIVMATLYDCGVEGAEIEDKVPLTSEELRQMFVDIAPVPAADDGIARLHFYLDPDQDTASVLENVRNALDELRGFTDIGPAQIEETETEDTDWINNWKQYFHQFYVDDILITPSWEEVKPEDKDRMILHIDPGTAFGTGMHETTQLCIRQLRKHVTPQTELLDIGTGSGILAILALMMGARHAVGTDLDPCAVPAVQDNMAANGIAASDFDLYIGNLIDDADLRETVGAETYDIAAANILAGVLVPLMPAAAYALKKGGIYITSGILAGYEDRVRTAAAAAGLSELEETRQGEWVSLTFRKE